MKIVRHLNVSTETVAADLLSEQSSLSKSAIKDCMNKGGVWLKRSRQKEKRIRKAKYRIFPGDKVSIYYDEDILRLNPPQPHTISSNNNYSVWYKPAGLLSQGSQFGDHCSLLRIVERRTGKAFLVHRLDREADGLVLIAHSREAASRFSNMFSQGLIEKRYRATASGILGKPGDIIIIDDSLDNKDALTEVRIVAHNRDRNRSQLDIVLHTGRYHQIRRHMSSRGFPLIGDYRYGKGSDEKLHLTAYSLSFQCPFSGETTSFTSHLPS